MFRIKNNIFKNYKITIKLYGIFEKIINYYLINYNINFMYSSLCLCIKNNIKAILL